jgi:ribosomal protein S18 acetylase RimI-like enzyme
LNHRSNIRLARRAGERSMADPATHAERAALDPALVFRRATAADAPAVRALTRQAYGKWVPIIGREPKPMTADYDAAIRDHRIDCLCDGGRIVALIETVAEPASLLIENVAVSPDFQGRGLGRRLIAHAESLAADMGYPTTRLYTNAAFVENVALYQSLGYAMTREEPFLGGRVVHMSKRLSPA